jgi:hypothetical protein
MEMNLGLGRKLVLNTVMGIPEPEFRAIWISKLWQAMAKTGKGYRRPSLRHTGKGDDRREDKKGFGGDKLSRRLMQRVQVA